MAERHTTLSEVGEFGLIQRIEKLVDVRVDDASLRDTLLKGISDDAAVYRPSPGFVQLLTTDAFVEGVHFDLTFTSFRHLGWKVITANLSDIASMGGTPRYATIALSLPQKISVEMIEEFYEGVAFACRKYACLVAGGDTTLSRANMFVSVAMTGECSEQHVVYRAGAKPGDYLCVTGHLGASLAGLKVLEREKGKFLATGKTERFSPNLEPYKDAIEKHLMPKPRLDIARLFGTGIAVHAMIDISDGLASEVHHLCAAGNVGATVFEHNIPLEAVTQRIAEEFSEQPMEYALYGGEEYELLFAIGEEDFASLDRRTNDVTIIGRITEQKNGIELVREQGDRVPLRAGGWDHFAQG